MLCIFEKRKASRILADGISVVQAGEHVEIGLTGDERGIYAIARVSPSDAIRTGMLLIQAGVAAGGRLERVEVATKGAA